MAIEFVRGPIEHGRTHSFSPPDYTFQDWEGCPIGTRVTFQFHQVRTRSPLPGMEGDRSLEGTSAFTVIESNPNRVVVEYTTSFAHPGTPFTMQPSRLVLDRSSDLEDEKNPLPNRVTSAALVIAGKVLECTCEECEASFGEMRAWEKVWRTPELPGRIARREFGGVRPQGETREELWVIQWSPPGTLS